MRVMKLLTSMGLGAILLSAGMPAMAKPVMHNKAHKSAVVTPLMPFQPGQGETLKTGENGVHHFNHRTITIAVEPSLTSQGPFYDALKAGIANWNRDSQVHFKLLGDYTNKADVVFTNVNLPNIDNGSRVDTFQYAKRPAEIHRSLVEFDYAKTIAYGVGNGYDMQSYLNQAVMHDLGNAAGIDDNGDGVMSVKATGQFNDNDVELMNELY